MKELKDQAWMSINFKKWLTNKMHFLLIAKGWRKIYGY
jgi:hypothetical protein